MFPDILNKTISPEIHSATKIVINLNNRNKNIQCNDKTNLERGKTEIKCH